MITDRAVYSAGRRRPGMLALDRAAVPNQPDSFVWIDLLEPTAEELAWLQTEYSLHPLAAEDVAKDHK